MSKRGLRVRMRSTIFGKVDGMISMKRHAIYLNSYRGSIGNESGPLALCCASKYIPMM